MLAILAFLAVQDVESLLASAQKHLARNDLPAAARDFTRVLEKDPARFEALLGRGKVRLKTGDPEGAGRDLGEALRLKPASSDAWFWRGVLREQLKDLTAAVEDFTRSLETGGRNPVVRLRRGTCLCYLGRFAEARTDLDAVVAQGRRTYESHSLRAWARFELLDLKGTVSDATRALELNPHDAEARRRRGIAYAGLRSWENALRDLEADAAAGAYLRDRLAGGTLVPAPGEALARVEAEAARREKVARALDALEEKLRAQKPFRAEYAVTGVEGLPGVAALSRLVIDVDLGGKTFIGRAIDERDGSVTVEFRDEDTYAWGAATPARRIEGRIFRPDFDNLPAEVAAEGLEVDLSLEGRGPVRLSARTGGRAASWLSEPGRSPGSTCREEEEVVVFEVPASRKTLAVDRPTGILRSLRVLDFDGKVRELKRVSLGAAGKPPARPARLETAPLDFGTLEARWQNREAELAELLAAKADAGALLTRWGARYAESMNRFAVRSVVRSQLQGGPKEAAELRRALEARAEDLRNFRRARLAELAYGLETRLLERPVDSRLHAGLKKLLAEALGFDKVEAARTGDPFDAVLREELEAARRR